jgi:3'-phosphoadenosine 5'-phosphosulfate sulfotransferase (PAPS reductase)/FAD synthetase
MSHYTLPEGNVQISFSGGRTSAYMLHCLLETNNGLPDRCIISFQNTGKEHPSTLEFVQEVSSRWSVPIVWVEYRPKKPLHEVVSHNSASRNGEPFEALLKRRKALPNIAMRFCTAELKVLTARRYAIANGWRKWTSALGIRADEAHRAKVSKDKRITNWHPLCDAGVVSSDIKRFWAAQSWGLNLPHLENGNPYGNCSGCFLKSEHAKSMLARERPTDFDWWEKQEQRYGALWRDKLPLRGIRETVERQGDWIFDTEGALCQADDGECTG